MPTCTDISFMNNPEFIRLLLCDDTRKQTKAAVQTSSSTCSSQSYLNCVKPEKTWTDFKHVLLDQSSGGTKTKSLFLSVVQCYILNSSFENDLGISPAELYKFDGFLADLEDFCLPFIFSKLEKFKLLCEKSLDDTFQCLEDFTWKLNILATFCEVGEEKEKYVNFILRNRVKGKDNGLSQANSWHDCLSDMHYSEDECHEQKSNSVYSGQDKEIIGSDELSSDITSQTQTSVASESCLEKIFVPDLSKFTIMPGNLALNKEMTCVQNVNHQSPDITSDKKEKKVVKVSTKEPILQDKCTVRGTIETSLNICTSKYATQLNEKVGKTKSEICITSNSLCLKGKSQKHDQKSSHNSSISIQNYSKKSQYLTHKKKHYSRNSFMCQECQSSFQSLAKLRRHKLVHSGERPFACRHCGATFADRSHLNVHIRMHSGEKPFNCDVCGSSFSESTKLKNHKRIHSGEKPFVCEICGSSFSVSSSLKSHMKKHSGEKPFKCEICDFVTAHSSNLKSHILMHSGEKKFTCEKCGASFMELAKLKRHKMVHTGERPYNCEVCGARFADKSHLTVHLRIHSGEKPFKCKYCTTEFRESSKLKNHLRTHTGERPYVCEVCGSSFAVSYSLKSHMRRHTGEKPYRCDICGYATSQSSNLKTHMVIHNGNKPHTCADCGASFSEPSKLNRHKKIHIDLQEELDNNIFVPGRGSSEKGIASDNVNKIYLTDGHHYNGKIGVSPAEERPFCVPGGRSFMEDPLTLPNINHLMNQSQDNSFNFSYKDDFPLSVSGSVLHMDMNNL